MRRSSRKKVYVMTRSIEEMLRVCMCMYVHRSEDVKEEVWNLIRGCVDGLRRNKLKVCRPPSQHYV